MGLGEDSVKTGRKGIGHEEKRRQMLDRDRGLRGGRNKWTEQVLFHLVLPFCCSHPKLGCKSVAWKDLEKNKERGKCKESCS
jgi:hypothetical protein